MELKRRLDGNATWDEGNRRARGAVYKTINVA
jgi:hypothetical protein